MIEEPAARQLLDIAVESIRSELLTRRRWQPDLDGLPPELRADGASFVTLERDGDLVGCVGNLEPSEPLALDVARSASLAAFSDPRVPPVDPNTFREMSVKVSVLSPLEAMPAGSLDEVLAWLRPGVDGVVLGAGRARATFLPSVWSSLPDAREFLAQLLRKAGLRSDAWPAGAQAWRYSTDEFSDPGPRPAP